MDDLRPPDFLERGPEKRERPYTEWCIVWLAVRCEEN